MQKKTAHKIVIIGCGNVAWHLAKVLHGFGHSLFIYNHKQNAALNDFKTRLNCKTQASLNKIIGDADFYFVCVSDSFVFEVTKQLKIKNPNAVLLHTSGSLDSVDFGDTVYGHGVFYPLQTFSKKDNLEWKEIPVIVETSDEISQQKTVALAKQISNTVLQLKYKERLQLHLAAVFANNFTNALYVAASDLSKTDFKLLLPLIKQSVSKLETLTPLQAQTGPAKRNNEAVMKKHLALLAKKSELKKIYKQLSKLILKQQHGT
ncbi:MAG: DUF2520 domain-containing protein [Bacteroidetes bacterium]|nr:DUF2520 domain-containing protein [Bacteroidota bacterium]